MTGFRMLACGVCATLTAITAAAQDFPNKPLRIVTTAPGGASDAAARLLALGVTGPLGQQVIVDNRSGGVFAVEYVEKAQPDGYTVLLYANSMWIAPFMQEVSYDPIRDFAPITLAAISPNMLVVHPAVAANSVKELIALAGAKPGQLNYGSSGAGSSTHLAAELFKSMAHVNIVRVQYKAAGPVVNDLLGGHIQMMFATTGTVAPQVKSGKLKALGVTTARPSALAPGVPTVASAGLPGYEMAAIIALFAPAKTPAPIIKTPNQHMVRTLNQAESKDKFLAIGIEPVASSPQELVASMKSEMARFSKVIKDAGIRAD
jgi:tripartite-type tricarboxylate transporter receptor subunit TctC